MVLRPPVIEERLKAIADALFKLKELQRLPFEEFGRDYRNTWSAERGLQIAAEAVFDIGNHILSGHFQAAPKDYEDITRLLGQHGVLSGDLAGRLKGLGGFRNILVHEYLEVDPKKVYERLRKGLPDFEEFSRQILAWLDQNRPLK